MGCLALLFYGYSLSHIPLSYHSTLTQLERTPSWLLACRRETMLVWSSVDPCISSAMPSSTPQCRKPPQDPRGLRCFFTFLPLSFHPFLISQIVIVPMNFTCIIYFFVWLNLLNNHDFNIEQSNCGCRAYQVFKIRTEHRRGENSGISDTLSCKVVLNL